MLISSNQENIFGDSYQSCICSKDRSYKWQNFQISRHIWSKQGTFWWQIWGHRASERHFFIHPYTASPYLSIFHFLTVFSIRAATSMVSLIFFPYFFSANFKCWIRVLAVRRIAGGSSCKSGVMNHSLEVSVFLHGL